MPTTNPRISVTLTPEVAAVLRELASLTGNSQSATVGELLQMSLPVFERLVAGMRAAKQIEEAARGEIVEGLHRAQTRVEAQLGIALADLDEGFRPLLEEAEKVHRRGSRGGVRGGAAGARPTGGPGVATPVPVTRGSGPPRTGRAGRKR